MITTNYSGKKHMYTIDWNDEEETLRCGGVMAWCLSDAIGLAYQLCEYNDDAMTADVYDGSGSYATIDVHTGEILEEVA